MAKRIKWTKKALEEKFTILKYWNNRNSSNEYSKKLNKIFLESAKLIQTYPSLGRPTDDPEVKNILAKEYLIFYKETETEYNIVHIWDERRNPEEMFINLLNYYHALHHASCHHLVVETMILRNAFVSSYSMHWLCLRL